MQLISNYKGKIIPIVAASISLGVLFDWMFVGKIPGLSVLLYSSLVLGFTFYLAYRFNRQLDKSIYWLALVVFFFSFMVFVRANLFLAFLNICSVIYLLLLIAQLSRTGSKSLSQYEARDYFSVLGNTPFSIVGEFFSLVQRSLSNRQNTTESKSSVKPIIRGILLSLPILFLFVLLLSSADLVFKNIVNSIFDFNISGETISRSILIGFIASLFTGAYALIFIPSAKTDSNESRKNKKFILGATESSIILGSVAALFFVFVMIQFTYLFGGSNQVISSDFTYAEYARKGFIEIIMVAAVSLMLVSATNKYLSLGSGKQRQNFKILSSVLIIEVLVIMFSAHSRLNIYEDAYGFTTLRLFSHLFILWLAYAFGQLMFHILKNKTNSSYAFHVFVSILCFFAVYNVINPDSFIIRKNLDRFSSTGKLDLYYLRNLSEDAVPTLATLLNHPNNDLRQNAANILYKQRIIADDFPHWQSTNVSRSRANNIYLKYSQQIDTGKQQGNLKAFE